MIISAYNPETAELEKTYLSSAVSYDATALAVKNNEKFVVSGKVLVGEMGGERSEIRTVSAVNANKIAITVDQLDFDHDSDVPVYRLEFDKIRFYRRATMGDAPSLMTTIDVDVDNADKITRWDDTSATTSYFYQTAFYNSVDDEESDLSDPVQASGYNRKTIGSVIDGVVRRVRDRSFTVLGFEDYIDIANEVGDDLITQAQRPYTFLKRTVKLSVLHGQNYIDILAAAPDFWKFDYVEVDQNTIGTDHNYKEITPLTKERWDQKYNVTASPARDGVSDVALDEETKRLYISPTSVTDRTDAIILHYYKFVTELKTAGDLVETPNPTIYRYKLMAEFYSAKAEIDSQWTVLADKYETKYGNEVVKMQRVNRLDVGTPRSFRPPRAYRRRRYHL